MEMLWSDEAVERLRARYGTERTAFRLAYDTEGCGCAVNGVPALWAVDGPFPGDVPAQSGSFPLWHDPRQELFFEDTLRIDYLQDRQSFRLFSDSQTYTTRLVLADYRMKRTADDERSDAMEEQYAQNR